MLGNDADSFMTTPMQTTIVTQATARNGEMPAPRPTARVGMPTPSNGFLPGLGQMSAASTSFLPGFGDMLPGMGDNAMLPGMGGCACRGIGEAPSTGINIGLIAAAGAFFLFFTTPGKKLLKKVTG